MGIRYRNKTKSLDGTVKRQIACRNLPVSGDDLYSFMTMTDE